MIRFVLLLLAVSTSTAAVADCEVVDGDKKLPFDGTSLNGLLVEKKSLVLMNALFPHLNVIERIFKGEILTCTNCSERYVRCSR
jgi:hypothetical protein